MPTTAARAYRGLLRELRKSSIFNRSERNPIIYSSFRTSLLNRMPENPEDLSDAVKDIEATAGFLRADRNYKILLERYSPLHDLSEEERIKATARRVGLNTPTEYKPGS